MIERTKKWFGKFAIAALLIACASIIASAQQSKTHILLLDSSGSMRPRYDNRLKDWLIAKMFNAAPFSASDRVIMREFHDDNNVAFSANDKRRLYDGRFDPPKILAQVPQQTPGQNTDIVEAFEQAMADIQGFGISGDTLLWIVTDNVQDAGGSMVLDPLYQKIVSEKNIRAAFIFPLLKENGTVLQPTQVAMVMYLLHYAPQNSPLNINRMADDVGKKIENEALTWYPFEEQIKLDQANLLVNSEPAQIVDGRLVLPAIKEGTSPEFAIQFRLNSQLRGREIVSGKLSRPIVIVQSTPESLEAEGDPNAWSGEISPSSLTIKARQSSATNYTAMIRATNLSYRPSSFWNAVWGATSEPVDAVMQFAPEAVQTKLSLPALSQVKNLSSIQNVIQQGQNSKKAIAIPITFQVQYESLWRRVIASLMALSVLGLALAGAGVMLIKTRYELATPTGERILHLPLIGNETILINNEQAALITRKFGKLNVTATNNYKIDGELATRHLRDEDRFVLYGPQVGRSYDYSIKRLRKAQNVSVERDTILD
jgi:hypothetical protein